MKTCEEIRADLLPLSKQRESLATEIVSDRGDLQELQSEAGHVNPAELAQAEAKLAADEAKLRQIDAQVAAVRGQLVSNGCLVMQPQQILEIQFTNPPDLPKVETHYAQTVAFGHPDESTILGGKFPSRDAEQEWKQVLPTDLTNTGAHDEDYEGHNLVGATGWLLNPEFSWTDVPFDHPFGFDWEFMMALDQPGGDPNRYTFLLTPADQSCDEEAYPEAVRQAGDAKDPQGQPIIPFGPDGLPSLLGVEIDGGLVPGQFFDWRRGGVDQGDRVAVFGRWIVDCGHKIAITSCDGDHNDDVHPGLTAFRTEIHPPLLMAAARIATSALAPPLANSAPNFTRVLVTSRPYLVSQRFTTDPGHAYDDNQPDDGPFFSHMVNEVVKAHETLLGIPTGSLHVEAHPKIKSFPFQGSSEFHLTVRPPGTDRQPPGTGTPGPLTVAFQFTVRSGCSVEIRSDGQDAVDVVIKLNQDGYVAPQLPKRSTRNWTRQQLGEMDPAAADGYFSAETWSDIFHVWLPQLGGPAGAAIATAILEQGILTDEYDTSELVGLNMQDASHAISAPASNIPNLDIQSQLDALKQQRDQLAVVVQGDKGDLQELQSEASHVNPTILAKARATLAADEAKLKQDNDQIAALSSTPTQGVLRDDNEPYPVVGWLEVGSLQE